MCSLLNLDQLDKAKKFQLQATEVLAELLKSSNVQSTAAKLVDSLTEEFFMVASTYFEMVPSLSCSLFWVLDYQAVWLDDLSHVFCVLCDLLRW